jgi:hypothetical protein
VTYQHRVELHLLQVDIHPGGYANLRLDRVDQPGAVVVAPVGLDNDSRSNGDLDDAQVLLPRLADLRRRGVRWGSIHNVEDLCDVGGELGGLNEGIDRLYLLLKDVEEANDLSGGE